MMKQRWGLDRNVLRPTPGDPWGVEQHHWNTGAEENQQLNPGLSSKRPLRILIDCKGVDVISKSFVLRKKSHSITKQQSSRQQLPLIFRVVSQWVIVWKYLSASSQNRNNISPEKTSLITFNSTTPSLVKSIVDRPREVWQKTLYQSKASSKGLGLSQNSG